MLPTLIVWMLFIHSLTSIEMQMQWVVSVWVQCADLSILIWFDWAPLLNWQHQWLLMPCVSVQKEGIRKGKEQNTEKTALLFCCFCPPVFFSHIQLCLSDLFRHFVISWRLTHLVPLVRLTFFARCLNVCVEQKLHFKLDFWWFFYPTFFIAKRLQIQDVKCKSATGCVDWLIRLSCSVMFAMFKLHWLCTTFFSLDSFFPLSSGPMLD